MKNIYIYIYKRGVNREEERECVYEEMSLGWLAIQCAAGACHYPTKINSSAINQVEWPSLIRQRFLPSKKIRIHRNNRLASSSSVLLRRRCRRHRRRRPFPLCSFVVH